jgi:ketosteroid isomerase-like protein
VSDWRADLCRASYAAFERLDPEAAVELYDPDCEWDTGAASAALGETSYRGHDGVRALMSALRDVFPDWHPIIEELRAREDGAVLVWSRVRGTSRDSGMPIEIPMMGQVIEFRDRKILRVLQTAFPPPGWEKASRIRAS